MPNTTQDPCSSYISPLNSLPHLTGQVLRPTLPVQTAGNPGAQIVQQQQPPQLSFAEKSLNLNLLQNILGPVGLSNPVQLSQSSPIQNPAIVELSQPLPHGLAMTETQQQLLPLPQPGLQISPSLVDMLNTSTAVQRQQVRPQTTQSEFSESLDLFTSVQRQQGLQQQGLLSSFQQSTSGQLQQTTSSSTPGEHRVKLEKTIEKDSLKQQQQQQNDIEELSPKLEDIPLDIASPYPVDMFTSMGNGKLVKVRQVTEIFQCIICAKMFSSQEFLDKHLAGRHREHHEEDVVIELEKPVSVKSGDYTRSKRACKNGVYQDRNKPAQSSDDDDDTRAVETVPSDKDAMVGGYKSKTSASRPAPADLVVLDEEPTHDTEDKTISTLSTDEDVALVQRLPLRPKKVRSCLDTNI